MENECCPVCSAGVTGRNTIMEASRRDKDGKRMARVYLLESWCPQCAIFLTRRTAGVKDSGWVTSFVEEHTLTRETGQPELEMLRNTLKNDEEKIECLDKFLSVKKSTDRLYQFVRKDGTYKITGLVIKRDNFLVGEFMYLVEEV